MEPFVKASDVQRHFKVSRGTVHNWVHKQGCPRVLFGGLLRFKISEVEAWLRNADVTDVTRQVPSLDAPPLENEDS